MNELVSVIITTRNEEDVVEELLKSISAQTYNHIEVLVVDNHSTDRTASIARKHTKHVYQKGPERSTQRNYGARKSTGTYVMFLDADMRLSPTVIYEAVTLCRQHQSVAAVIVPEISVGSRFWEKIKAYERSFYCLESGEEYEAARFFRRNVFMKAGGFDETIIGPEDWDLPKTIRKKGYAIGRIRSVIYHRERIASVWSLARKKYYYGLKSGRYLTKQGIPLVSRDTVYFLRPVFYRHWRKIVSQPVMAAGMACMFLVELGAGGLGYLVGKLRDGNTRNS